VENRILDAIGSANGLSTKPVAEAATLSARSARTRRKALVEKGLIAEVGSSPTDPKRVYLPIDGPDRSRETEHELSSRSW